MKMERKIWLILFLCEIGNYSPHHKRSQYITQVLVLFIIFSFWLFISAGVIAQHADIQQKE